MELLAMQFFLFLIYAVLFTGIALLTLYSVYIFFSYLKWTREGKGVKR